MGKRRRIRSSWISVALLLGACSSEGPTSPLEPQPLQFTTIAVSTGNSCGLTDDGSVYCWGSSFGGLFGTDMLGACPPDQQFTCTTRPRRIESPVPLTTLAMSSSFGSYACGLAAGGAPYCWGSILVDVDQGQSLGAVPTALPGGVSLTSISTGTQHICGVAATHEAYCWGDFEGGRRGDPLIDFDTSAATFDPNVVGGGLQFAQVAAGSWGTCGLTTNGQAYCWGSNAFGGLGDPDAAVQQDCGFSPPPCALAPVPVAGGHAFTSLSGATTHVCGRTSAGEIYCWGQDDVFQIASAGSELCESDLRCVRQPALVFASDVSFESVSAGGLSSCGVAQDSAGFCWGDNSWGQIGNGGGTASVPARVTGGTHFSTIAIGGDHACGLTPDGAALCWGENTLGQLGTGDQQDSNEPVAVVGPAAD